MQRKVGIVFVIIFCKIIFSLGMGICQEYASTVPFSVASVHYEQNATDGDVEVVFQVKGGDEGLTNLTIVSPSGRTVVDFTASDPTTLGIRQFRFESPEPKDVKSLKNAYPEGVYKFSGKSVSAGHFYGLSTLSHELPDTTSFVFPAKDADNVKYRDLEISWRRVKNLAAHIFYIEQDELDQNINAKLSGSDDRFKVPDGFLLPNTEYKMGIGTVSESGNISYIEASFTTTK